MDAGGEFQRRDCRGEHVDEPDGLVAAHQMPATDLAIHALAEWCLLERRNMLSPGFDLHGVCFPEAESVDRTSRPGTAGIAMTIAHRLGLAGDLKLNSAAKTASRVTHGSSPFVDDQLDQLSGDRQFAIQCTNCTASLFLRLRTSAGNAFHVLARELPLLGKRTKAEPGLHGCREFPASCQYHPPVRNGCAY